MEDVRPSDLRPSDLRPMYMGADCSCAPRLRPSDWRFFIAELAVGALYEPPPPPTEEEERLDCGAIECRALRARPFFFVFFLAPPRDDAAAGALNVEEESTAKLWRREEEGIFVGDDCERMPHKTCAQS